jgi:hypothetical protein
MTTDPQLITALTELARATQRLADLHETLWLAMKPSARAKLLGVSRNTERNRRKAAEIQRALNS